MLTNRFSSLRLAPAETRSTLRDRFRRFLPVSATSVHSSPPRIALADEKLLKLLANTTLELANEETRVRALFNNSKSANEPTFDQRVSDGWFRIFWGRVWVGRNLSRVVHDLAKAEPLTAFATFVKARFDVTYRFGPAVLNDPQLSEIAKSVRNGDIKLREIGSETPAWVAARLWDRSYQNFASECAALRVWMDKWEILGSPSFIPSAAWTGPAYRAFMDGVTQALCQGDLLDWKGLRNRIAKEHGIAAGRTSDDLVDHLPVTPSTLVDRALWFEDHLVERSLLAPFSELDDISGIVRLLVNDVEFTTEGAPPHHVVRTLTDHAISRPELLLLLLFSFQTRPLILADLLLYPPASALACLVIARWHAPASAWDRELKERDDMQTKCIAFDDANSILVKLLIDGLIAPEECASLFRWLHQEYMFRTRGEVLTARLLHTMQDHLRDATPEILTRVLMAIGAQESRGAVAIAALAARLDIIGLGQLADHIDPLPVLAAYKEAAQQSRGALASGALDASASVAVCELALRTAPPIQTAFFYPVDIKDRLRVAKASKENPYTVEDELVSAVRAQLFILCRAISDWKSTPPVELVNALVTALKFGARADQDGGSVPAFAPRYETNVYAGPRRDRIAPVICAALSKLQGPSQSALLDAILETDEPAHLAQLLVFAPAKCKSRIIARIESLTPEQAGEIRSLPEAQARIEALLNAELVDAASLYIDAEATVTTLGRPPGRAMQRLQATLRLNLLRNDTLAIAGIQLPSDLTPAERGEAEELVRFYVALSALSDPNGDLIASEAALRGLHERHPQVPAYAINLFAARISILLGSNMFGTVRGDDAIRAREILAGADGAFLRIRSISMFDSEVITCNKALLLLAMDQPQSALDVLNATPIRRLADRHAAYSAVAMTRQDRTGEAIAVLNRAREEFGDSKVLQVARAFIENGFAPQLRADVVGIDDPIQRIKAAFADFFRMDAVRQAEVVHSPSEPDAFRRFIVDQMRSATGSLSRLVPMMKSKAMELHEDDLTVLARELLVSRLSFFGWSVADQSKGGFTAKGNFGEPDMKLQRDGSILAIYEAVVCPTTDTNLTMHLQKLLGYGTCRLFFHVSYSWGGEIDHLLSRLKSIAESEVPPGFEFHQSEDIPVFDDRPMGFLTRYGAGADEVMVAFLIVDLEQTRQRDAARAAGRKH
ncbi:MAG: hypothetical protein JOZ13_17460 [Alphaproteobacteria bacterium]|nr:hypothetical protein [Alphaproteobacteria bacterium]